MIASNGLALCITLNPAGNHNSFPKAGQFMTEKNMHLVDLCFAVHWTGLINFDLLAEDMYKKSQDTIESETKWELNLYGIITYC